MARRGVSPMALLAAGLLVSVAALYAWVIAGREGDSVTDTRPLVVLGALAGVATASVAGGIARQAQTRVALLAPAAAIVLALAALALFSIGVPLALPGVLLLVGAVRASAELEGRLAALTGVLVVAGAVTLFLLAVLLLA